jgi:hypothetical protein
MLSSNLRGWTPFAMCTSCVPFPRFVSARQLTCLQNDTLILAADNMFRTYRYQVSLISKEAPLKEGENTLLLHFKSAKLRAKNEEAEYGRVRAGSTNLGDPSRVYVRKAQYDWRYILFTPPPFISD